MTYLAVYFIGFVLSWLLFAWCDSVAADTPSDGMGALLALIWPFSLGLFIMAFFLAMLELLFKKTVAWFTGGKDD